MVEVHVSSLTQLVCALAESTILVVAFVAATFIRFGHLGYENVLPKALLSTLVVQLCFYYSDLYEESALRWRVEIFLRQGQALIVAVVNDDCTHLGGGRCPVESSNRDLSMSRCD